MSANDLVSFQNIQEILGHPLGASLDRLFLLWLHPLMFETLMVVLVLQLISQWQHIC